MDLFTWLFVAVNGFDLVVGCEAARRLSRAQVGIPVLNAMRVVLWANVLLALGLTVSFVVWSLRNGHDITWRDIPDTFWGVYIGGLVLTVFGSVGGLAGTVFGTLMASRYEPLR